MKPNARDVFVFASMVLMTALPARAQGPPMLAVSPMNIEFMSGPIAFDNEQVAGVPYSAEAVTTIVQSLADGNRIVRESKAQISRDGKGRTRREQGLAMFGPLVGGANGAGEQRHVQISDPETKTTIMLDLENKIAHRMPAPQFRLMQEPGGAIAGGGRNVEVEHFEMALPPPPGSGGRGSGGPGAGYVAFSSHAVLAGGGSAKPIVEDLGKQFMEGVSAEGTKTTMTIPAGQIGNELPIHVISERWFSPELKILVMSRQSDPRFGETSYRLTNITRGEPSPDLFDVPSDFKVFDPGNNRNMIMEGKIINK